MAVLQPGELEQFTDARSGPLGGFQDLRQRFAICRGVAFSSERMTGRGLDDGQGRSEFSASTMMLAGPVDDVRLGERPDLGDLDAEGNLKTAVPFDRYLATLAEEWLGAEAAGVLPEAATPLGIF